MPLVTMISKMKFRTEMGRKRAEARKHNRAQYERALHLFAITGNEANSEL